MKLEVLLSAMYLTDCFFINTLNINTDCVVVNQCDIDDHIILSDKNRNVIYISTRERGLSKSRNMALRHATADICLFCDNDVVYVDNYEEIIKQSFEIYKEFDIIVFFVQKNKEDVPLFLSPKKLNRFSVLRARSVEIAFRRRSVAGIFFDERFGAGARYASGEENLFLSECLRRGLKAMYVPVRIASLRDVLSTWFAGYNKRYFLDKGAFFGVLSPRLSLLLILRFAILKYNLYKDEMSFRGALKNLFEGRKMSDGHVSSG